MSVQLEHMKCTGASAEEIADAGEVGGKGQAAARDEPHAGHSRLPSGNPVAGDLRHAGAAIMEAACNVLAESGKVPHVEIMIPLVGFWIELKMMRALTEKTANAVLAERSMEIPYQVGTMIELPRAAVTADEIAQYADFFSFGTMSDPDHVGLLAGRCGRKFLTFYTKQGILKAIPSRSWTKGGWGNWCHGQGEERGVNPTSSWASVVARWRAFQHRFLPRVGLTTSVAALPVPLARLAAAQAALNKGAGPASNA